jgi:hypothetical protein
MRCNPPDVFHYLVRLGKDLLIYPLMGVPDTGSCLIPRRNKGIVYMALTEGFGCLKFAVNGKFAYHFQ